MLLVIKPILLTKIRNYILKIGILIVNLPQLYLLQREKYLGFCVGLMTDNEGLNTFFILKNPRWCKNQLYHQISLAEPPTTFHFLSQPPDNESI